MGKKKKKHKAVRCQGERERLWIDAKKLEKKGKKRWAARDASSKRCGGDIGTVS